MRFWAKSVLHSATMVSDVGVFFQWERAMSTSLAWFWHGFVDVQPVTKTNTVVEKFKIHRRCEICFL